MIVEVSDPVKKYRDLYIAFVALTSGTLCALIVTCCFYWKALNHMRAHHAARIPTVEEMDGSGIL